MVPRTNAQSRPAAYFFLEGLVEVGIDYLFCNFGTDHAPLIEELAHRRKLGAPVPKTIRCAHENTAAHMAGGYAFVTGRGQGVLVHVDVGTANAANAMHNLLRTRIPVLLIAGKAPFTSANELVGTRDNYIHFIQEPFDQGSLVRPYVKWEWTLPSGIVAKEALRRAHSVMHSEPQGPVYLMVQRETLTQMWNDRDIRSYGTEQFGFVPRGVADPEHVSELAKKLLLAQRPILITAYGGRNPNTSKAIEEIAEFAGIPVYESSPINNISREGICFMGYDPDQEVISADVGLLVDVDVPWFPYRTEINASTYWAHIDVDVLKTASPMWSFPGNLRLQGDSARTLQMLIKQLKQTATSKFRENAALRLESFKRARSDRIAQAANLANHKGLANAINPHHLFSELGKLLEPTDLIFDESVTNTSPLVMQVPRPISGTMLRLGGAGLGASGGMALGAKLAAPERMMVQVVGDGSFYFNVPSSVYAASQQHGLPFLSIVLDNSGWGAVKQATLKVYPDGRAKDSDEYESGLCPDVEFGKVAEAFGAYAEKLTNPDDVTDALNRCIDVVRGGRTALLHVRVTSI
jgi:acetolactate synthase-1/2/3 large subunit